MSTEWQKMSKRISNWGRWGEHDQMGTLNFITPDKIAAAAALARTGKVFSLCIPIDGDGPMASNSVRRNPVHLMTLDGGDSELVNIVKDWKGRTALDDSLIDMYAPGPMRFNDDYLFMALQSSTQWDALSHVYYDDHLYNGYPAKMVTSTGATRDSID